jgi:hypothetical protein
MSRYITYFEIAAFLASLAAWGVIRRSSYLRLFPLLLLLIVGVEVYETFFLIHRTPNAWLYNWQVPAQHLLYLLILYYSMEKPSTKRMLLTFMSALLVFTPLSWLLFTARGRFNGVGYCFGSILVVIGIIMKFYEMLQNPSDYNFLRKPFFYMLFAFLLFNLGSLPYFAMGNWLYYTIGYKDAVLVLIQVMSILNYILYTTYTIAFIWILQRKAYS